MQYFSNEYLEHHGILGQKWGVRRFQNRDGSLTRAGKKRLGGKKIIPKGTQIQNVSIGERNLTKSPVYGFANEHDKKWYSTKHAGDYYVGKRQTIDVRLNTFETQNELKIPSYNLAYKTMRKVHKQSAKNNPDKDVEGIIFYDDDKAYNKWLNQTFRAKKNTKGIGVAFASMYTNTMLRDEYFKRLAKKGYNAVRDYEDVLARDVAEPFLIFNGKKELKKIASTQIIPEDKVVLLGNGEWKSSKTLRFDGDDKPYYEFEPMWMSKDQQYYVKDHYSVLEKKYGRNHPIYFKTSTNNIDSWSGDDLDLE